MMGKPEGAFDRSMKLEDTVLGWRFVNPRMKAAYGVDPMGQTAENVATEHQISRTDQDAFAYRSQRRCKAAQDRGFFEKEIVKVCVKKGKMEIVVEKDEHPRGDTTMETLSKLSAAFRDGGSVTAGNSSGLNDGACAMIIASEAAARRRHRIAAARHHEPARARQRIVPYALPAEAGLLVGPHGPLVLDRREDANRHCQRRREHLLAQHRQGDMPDAAPATLFLGDEEVEIPRAGLEVVRQALAPERGVDRVRVAHRLAVRFDDAADGMA